MRSARWSTACWPQGQSCLLVDDGSRESCAAELRRQAAREGVRLLRLDRNRGKGGAMLAGFREAARLGASHVLQIDADGQHDATDIPRFLQAAQAAPDAVINGAPVYDASVPKGRLYGATSPTYGCGSTRCRSQIRDSMCGFRVYPLAPVLKLIDEEFVGQRMDFDPEIVVRLHWRGVGIENLATPVRYPSDGVSHFDVWRDNVRISRMHTRLFFGMLRRLPRLALRALR
jgi:glycosyltransferase involved in cell wall biosynthesis